MPKFHQQTKHSYQSVRSFGQMIDWDAQPRNHKIYPHFFKRIATKDVEEYPDLNLMGGITLEREYPNGMFYLRTVPTAGGLFPCEVYMQARGVKGLADGIYHYEPHSAALTRIKVISNEGVETYFKNMPQQKGLVFLVSAVAFRSFWKYRDRAIRYILLDSGHQLGAIYGALSAMGLESKMYFNFDKPALNRAFGFRDEEMFTCAITCSEPLQKEARTFIEPLDYVCGCDYMRSNDFVYNSYKDSAKVTNGGQLYSNLYSYMPKNQLIQAILKRRSIRAFFQKNISSEEFDFILRDLFALACENNIEIYYTTHLVDGMRRGLYKHEQLLKEGDFRSKSRYLALEQNIGGQSAATFYFTSSEVENYQMVNILSGFIAQIIYVKAEAMGIGCTGIGAYYDDECKEFLGTKNNILYLLAIGR